MFYFPLISSTQSIFLFRPFYRFKGYRHIPTNTNAKQKLKLFADAMANIRRKLSDDNAFAIIDLLFISLRFECERITKMAVGIIDLLDKHVPDFGSWAATATGDLTAVKRINMALRHDAALRHWCLPALQCLVNRPAPPTAEEGRSLGYHRMAIVVAEREERLRSGGRGPGLKSIPAPFLLSD